MMRICEGRVIWARVAPRHLALPFAVQIVKYFAFLLLFHYFMQATFNNLAAK